MPILQSRETKYTFSTQEITKLIAADLGKKEENIRVDFVVQDTSDDRFGHSPSYQLTKIEVTVKE